VVAPVGPAVNDYVYTVKAVGTGGTSAGTNAANVTFGLPTAPAALVAIPANVVGSATRDTVALTWAAAPVGTTVTIQRIRPAALGGGTTTLVVPVGATSFTDLNIQRSATAAYIYQIRINQGPLSSAYVQTSVIVN
jgi:hypothetical protein